MNKKKIACIFGGNSSEYEISLASAASIIRAIDINCYDIVMIGISRKGDFYLYEGEIKSIQNDNWLNENVCRKVILSPNVSDHGFWIVETKEFVPIDLVFPILHGRNGEDGRLQGLLELAGIPYVGCDMVSSALCMDKKLAHDIVRSHGIETAKSLCFHKGTDIEQIINACSTLLYPLFVKPLRAGSSIGISMVKRPEDMDKAIQVAFSYDTKIIIEESIDGFEVGCAIMGTESLMIGEVDEIEKQDFFDFEKKYYSKKEFTHLPARLPFEESERIKAIAIEIYRALGCSGLARVDMFYTSTHSIVFNEVNTMPGFTTNSRFPKMLEYAGFPFESIIREVIRLSLESNTGKI